MKNRALLCLLAGAFLWPFSLSALPPEFQEIKALFSQINHTLNGQKVDLEILHEKVDTLDNELHLCQEQLKKGGSIDQKRYQTLEQRVTTLETEVHTLLQNHNKVASQVERLQTTLESLQKELSSDISSLKESLYSMLSLLSPQQTTSPFHTVQPGDSLSKIALQYHISTKLLREANSLSSDKIVVGQKLKIPPKS